MFMSIEAYQERSRKIVSIAENLPEIDWFKDSSTASEFLAHLIGEIDYRNGDIFYLKFGGDGDNGEILIKILDLLVTHNIIDVKENII